MTKPCDHCDAPATETWDLKACAEGRQPRVINLCVDCDVDLNRLVLTFAGVEDAVAVVDAYARSRGIDRL